LFDKIEEIGAGMTAFLGSDEAKAKLDTAIAPAIKNLKK
jgi:hypothetical protein